MQDYIFKVFPKQNFLDLSMFQFGWEQCSAAQSFGPVARNHYIFHYVISGSGLLHAGDQTGQTKDYMIKQNEGFLLFPNQISTYIADNEHPWEYVWVEFDGLKVKETLETIGISKDKPLYRSQLTEMRENMVKELLYIVHNKDESSMHLMGHLYLFFDYFTRSATSKNTSQKYINKQKSNYFYITEAINFIEQNYQNDISVEMIAGNCGLNRSYFGKIFKAEFGKTPQEFLMQYRMAKATELLKRTEMSIGDIGKAVGYPDQLHFSRAFKNTYDISPRQWRNKYGQ
jgi:AraC-like DNA-binding protein